MSPIHSLNLLQGYLDAQQYAEEPRLPSRPQPFVTLSREAGAGGITIGQRLRDSLQAACPGQGAPWMWFDRELITRVVEQHNLPAELARTMDYTQYNRILKWVDDLFGSNPAWSTLVKKTNETILHLAGLGNVILVGRGAHLLTRDLPGGLNVRLVGSVPVRVRHLAEYFSISLSEAEKLLIREDGGRAGYLKDYFNVDIRDPHCYDLTINTDHVSYDDAVSIVVDQVKRVRERLRRTADAEGREGG